MQRPSFVPRLHPIFQCCTLKNGKAWFAKSRAQHWAGMGQVNERRRGTKPRTAKRHAFFQIQVISTISGWSQRVVANCYYFTYIKVYVQTLL